MGQYDHRQLKSSQQTKVKATSLAKSYVKLTDGAMTDPRYMKMLSRDTIFTWGNLDSSKDSS